MPKLGSDRARSHRLPHLQLQRRRLADGTIREYWYHRLTRKKVVGTPGTLEFANSYAEAAKAAPVDRDPINLTHLIRQSKESPEFADLASRTQRDYDRILQSIEVAFGDAPLAAVNDRRFRGEIKMERDRRSRASRRQADYFVSVFSALLEHAVDGGRLDVNHARGITKLYASERAEKIWLPADEEIFRKFASVEMQLALALAVNTGQREGDLLRLPWSAFDGKALTLCMDRLLFASEFTTGVGSR